MPTPDLERVRTNPALSMFSKVSHRVIYLYPDTSREKSPFVTDRDDAPSGARFTITLPAADPR